MSDKYLAINHCVLGSAFKRSKIPFYLLPSQELHYSHLILATGSDGPFPGKFNQVIDMESAIQTYEDLIKEVRNQFLGNAACLCSSSLSQIPLWLSGAICV